MASSHKGIATATAPRHSHSHSHTSSAVLLKNNRGDQQEDTQVPYRTPCPNAGPPSPCQAANIRLRRAHHGPALLQSPARAGHAARMRQIFEDAGRENQTPRPNGDSLYPQLPNISRKASPPPEHKATEARQTPHHSPIRRPDCTAVSEASSESWSDDSGYFIAGSRTRSSSSVTVPPGERISKWLLSVSPYAPEHTTEVTEGQVDSLTSSSPEGLPWDFLDDTPHPQGTKSPVDPFVEDEDKLKRHSLFSGTKVSLDDPNVAHSTVIVRSLSPSHNNNSNSNSPKPTILGDGGLELSPLSPNVCIERGPTRHHSAHRNPPSPSPSPIQKRPPAQYRRSRFQEKVATGLVLESPRGRKNVLAPCKIGVGTRFQHARHNMGGGGLGRPVQD